MWITTEQGGATITSPVKRIMSFLEDFEKDGEMVKRKCVFVFIDGPKVLYTTKVPKYNSKGVLVMGKDNKPKFTEHRVTDYPRFEFVEDVNDPLAESSKMVDYWIEQSKKWVPAY